MKTVFITGASSGIGYAATLLFARAGHQVIATMRNAQKQQALQNLASQEKLKIDVRQLDITDEKSIQSVIENVLQVYGKLDVLINNAGSGFLGTLEQTTLAEAQNIMDVNFFGVWRMTQAVLPSMRKNKYGHIISVSSIGGIIGQPFNDAYCAAKFAVEGMMESLAPVAQRLGIQVSLVEPGPVSSEFVSTTLDTSPTLSDALEKDYAIMLASYAESTKNAFAQLAQTPNDIAKILLEIATAEKAHFRYQTSAQGKKAAELKFVDTTGNTTIELVGSRLPAAIPC